MISHYRVRSASKIVQAVYTVKVSEIGRRAVGRTVVEVEFLDYDRAQEFLDRMEAIYGSTHIVVFDTIYL
jgi:hypothetical protein